MKTILGIKINDRLASSQELQAILSEYGCHITTRIGLHTTDNNICSPVGTILLEVNEQAKAIALEQALLKIDNVEIQKMAFN